MTASEWAALPPTTVEQAKVILKRNVSLLARVNSIILEVASDGRVAKVYCDRVLTEHGCPHCKEGYPCSHGEACAWGNTYAACIKAIFNGISYSRISGLITYAWNLEVVTAGCLRHRLESDALELINDAKSFLEGHIEWALQVINAQDQA